MILVILLLVHLIFYYDINMRDSTKHNYTPHLNTWGFWRYSEMSVGHEGHCRTFFCDRSVRPPLLLSLTEDIPANAPSKHALQKLWAQGVVTGRVMTCRQIRQLNSACNTYQISITALFNQVVPINLLHNLCQSMNNKIRFLQFKPNLSLFRIVTNKSSVKSKILMAPGPSRFRKFLDRSITKRKEEQTF